MSRERGVSSVIGVVMILAITMAAITSILIIGGAALTMSQDETDISQMETSMAQMSSKASLTALGDSGMHQFNLGDLRQGELEIKEMSGSVTIEYIDQDNNTVQENTTQLGALVYTNGDTEVAFQGGGVWKSTSDDGGEMISPPEYHYLSRTLTFPVVTISGEGTSSTSGSGTISKVDSETQYPIGDRQNPIENETVYIEIESDYHRGWYEFFDSRTDGNISHDSENQTVRTDLTALYEDRYRSPIAAESFGDVHDLTDTSDFAEGSNYPSVSDAIEDEIAACDPEESGYESFSDALGDFEGDTTYCGDEHSIESFEDSTFDTTTGDIDVVLPGGIDFDGDDLDIEGDGTVRFHVNDSIDFGNSELNYDNNASQFFLFIHENIEEIEITGNLNMHGVFYAPDTDVTFSGNIDFQGALIANEFSADNPGGQGAGEGGITIDYDSSLNELEELGFSHRIDQLRFLHITENEIRIQLD